MKKQVQKGFTLIELMIVVAIIGILASIALPAYQDYIARSQAAESVVMLDGARISVEDYVVQNGQFPDDLDTVSVNTTGSYGALTNTHTAGSDAGTIVYTFKSAGGGVNSNLAAATVTYTRTANTGAWACTTSLAAKFRPKGCGAGS